MESLRISKKEEADKQKMLSKLFGGSFKIVNKEMKVR